MEPSELKTIAEIKELRINILKDSHSQQNIFPMDIIWVTFWKFLS